MRTHAAEQQVQLSGCNALFNLFCDDSEHAQLANEATRMVVAAMTAHSSDGDVQREACNALFSMSVLKPACNAVAAAAGGIEASVAALRAHGADALLQIAGCDVLGCFCTNMPAHHQAKAIAAGGIEAVVQALRGHATDAAVQRSGCAALVFLVKNSRGSVQRANAAGALAAVVASAMGTAAATVGVLDAVYGALLQLVPGH